MRARSDTERGPAASGRHAGRRCRRSSIGHRGAHRRGPRHVVSWPEQPEDERIWPRRARRLDARIASSPKLLADLLERHPSALTRTRRWQPHGSQPVERRQDGHPPSLELPSPEVARHLAIGGNRELCECAVPLRPGGLLAVSEVHAADDVALLPAAVARRIGLVKRIAAVGRLTPPPSGDRDRVDVHSGDGRFFERRYEPRHLAVVAAADDL